MEILKDCLTLFIAGYAGVGVAFTLASMVFWSNWNMMKKQNLLLFGIFSALLLILIK